MLLRVGILTAPAICYELTDGGFCLHNVRIGIGFHWDRCEDQLFEGQLEIINNPDGTQTAVNILDMEDYLTSVISSEMAPSAPLELLKAHAVISRSWLLNAIAYRPHENFDVCADDHCQRYEGITRRDAQPQCAQRVREAVNSTRGMILVDPTDDNAVCDTRYHKCCGGRTELFENCWENKHYRYLQSVECPYCNPASRSASVRNALNDYDQETTDFYRWTVHYTDDELASIVRDKAGADFGRILQLRPLKRGPSYRIYELEIVGSRRSEIVGKELRIRQLLSRTTLYSSAFDALHSAENGWTLTGRGWGHGVGLCQIGATTMANNGADYIDILNYYYPGTVLQVLSEH